MKLTPTPRTNAVTKTAFRLDGGNSDYDAYVVMMNFARELERELAALTFAAARVEWKYGRNDDGTPKNWTEWNDLREALGSNVRQPQELDTP